MPIVVMALATSAFGNELEDRTLNVLVLKPISRAAIVLPKLLASILVTAPLMAGAGVAVAVIALGDGGVRAALATGVALGVGAITYAAMFTWAGLLSSKALGFALVYVFLWEATLSSLFDGVRFLSVKGYTMGILYGLDETTAPAATATVTPTPRPPVTVTLSASKDTTLYEGTGGLGNGSGEHLFVGNTNSNRARRTLVLFDVASVVPSGATITSVSLDLRVDRTQAANTPVTVHRVLNDWGEGSSNASGQEGGGTLAQTGDATWTDRFVGGESWAMPGGDFVATASGSTAVGGIGLYSWTATPALIADVQGWLDDASSNHGRLLSGSESARRTAKRFASREAGATGPVLTLQYTPAG